MSLLPVYAEKAMTPIYDGTRSFLGRKDLVVSFYTEKCQFECSYCALPQRSANAPVSVDALNGQIDWVVDKYRDAAATIGQFSFGNEGSALDARRFFPQSLHHLLESVKEFANLEVLSIETRPEYVREPVLRDVLQRTHARKVDVTIGVETQDDDIRDLLNKKMSRKLIEDRIAVCGELGVRMTSYVMVKPAPGMTEEEGVTDSLATIGYLAEQCGRRGVELVIYLTPTYIAMGSQLAMTTKAENYLPPTIQSVLTVIVKGRQYGVPIYTGLWSEELAEEGNDFRGRRGYDPQIRKAILAYNRTNDFTHLEPYLDLVG
jgi:radical SAM enzyme (TIGR01210 family)